MNGIREMRIKCGMTQKELGLEIGANEKLVSAWEHGKGIPPAKKMLEMARLFGCTVYDLNEGLGVRCTYLTQLGALRREKGLTQRDVAEALGVNFCTVSNWETCKARIGKPNLSRLANLYGVQPEDILHRIGIREKVCVDVQSTGKGA